MANINVNKDKRKCIKVLGENKKCNCIAIIGSDYCRHHSNLDLLTRKALKAQAQLSVEPKLIDNINKSRYQPAIQSVRERMNINIASPHLLDLRSEVALLQALEQNLLDAPVVNYEKQLQIIDRIERCIHHIKTHERADAIAKTAEQKVQVTINQLAIIINEEITDKALRVKIAQRLADFGIKQERAALTPGFTESETVINNQEPLINNATESESLINNPVQGASIINNLQEPSQVDQQAHARGIGDPAPGSGIEQDIPSPRVLPVEEVSQTDSVTGAPSPNTDSEKIINNT